MHSGLSQEIFEYDKVPVLARQIMCSSLLGPESRLQLGQVQNKLKNFTSEHFAHACYSWTYPSVCLFTIF